mgnify:CR=1 FL=1
MMRTYLAIPLVLMILIPISTSASNTSQVDLICKSFSAGEVDAYKTLEALTLELNDYSIGVNNTAKIFCS